MKIFSKLRDATRRLAIFLLFDPKASAFERLDIVTTRGDTLRFQLYEKADGSERYAAVSIVVPDDAPIERRLTREDVGEFSSGLKTCASLARGLAPRRPTPRRSFLQRFREALDPMRDLRILVAFASAPTADGALGAVLGVRSQDATPVFYLCFATPMNEPQLFLPLRLADLPKIERFMTNAVFRLAPARR